MEKGTEETIIDSVFLYCPSYLRLHIDMYNMLPLPSILLLPGQLPLPWVPGIAATLCACFRYMTRCLAITDVHCTCPTTLFVLLSTFGGRHFHDMYAAS